MLAEKVNYPLAENLGFVPSTHMETNNSPQL